MRDLLLAFFVVYAFCVFFLLLLSILEPLEQKRRSKMASCIGLQRWTPRHCAPAAGSIYVICACVLSPRRLGRASLMSNGLS